ncbi:MAG: hypothetical protein GY804_09115 [Alphaproteobacteria bacterium]|nr:hypothetical protein [Alphaproteobacteria bacterium]
MFKSKKEIPEGNYVPSTKRRGLRSLFRSHDVDKGHKKLIITNEFIVINDNTYLFDHNPKTHPNSIKNQETLLFKIINDFSVFEINSMGNKKADSDRNLLTSLIDIYPVDIIINQKARAKYLYGLTPRENYNLCYRYKHMCQSVEIHLGKRFMDVYRGRFWLCMVKEVPKEKHYMFHELDKIFPYLYLAHSVKFVLTNQLASVKAT